MFGCRKICKRTMSETGKVVLLEAHRYFTSRQNLLRALRVPRILLNSKPSVGILDSVAVNRLRQFELREAL